MSSTVAALLVTHDSAATIELTLRSILSQRHAPDEIVVVDDDSQDDTRAIIERVASQVRILRATSRTPDVTTRIAQNFQQGVRACARHEVVVLGDHDDLWHPARIGHQVNQLRTHRGSTMIASDGRLVDAKGRPTGSTLRSTFPVPADFAAMTGADQMRTALRHSIATGGASALRPSAFADVVIPHGWLHDRWWSLVATARQELLIDDDLVIDYRVSAEQQVGLDTAQQQATAVSRLRHAAAHAPQVLGRLRDLQGLRAEAATSEIAGALAPLGLLTALR